MADYEIGDENMEIIRAIFANDSDSEEEFEGFTVEEIEGANDDNDLDAVDNVLSENWEVDPGRPVLTWCHEYDLAPGRRGVLVDKTPVDYFKLFINDELFELIAEQTNIYAGQNISH